MSIKYQKKLLFMSSKFTEETLVPILKSFY